jgi:hypothetical protein
LSNSEIAASETRSHSVVFRVPGIYRYGSLDLVYNVLPGSECGCERKGVNVIFKSELVKAHWDTWAYYHQGTYYLYYLITEHGPGEGFGVATSTDGVHWHDHGWVLRASEQMVRYLGTGAVWQAADFEETGRFICNYSEHRVEDDGRPTQNILFAWSTDLLQWHKYGDEHMFRIDQRFYEKYGRWDCIYAIPPPEGGYFGTWTATPLGRAGNDGGIGFGCSEDGRHWQALPPAEIIPDADEAGAIALVHNRVHAMFGRGRAMIAYRAENFEGPFKEAEQNSVLLAPGHTYFSRLFNVADDILVNHHAMDGRKTSAGRAITYVAPFKRFSVDQYGIQRWLWWEGNEKLKGRPVLPSERCDLQQGVIVEGSLPPVGSEPFAELRIEADDKCFAIRFADNGALDICGYDPGNASWTSLQKADRQLTPGTRDVRLLLRRGMLEVYIDNNFMECCHLGCPDAKYVRVTVPEDRKGWPAEPLRAWQMDL